MKRSDIACLVGADHHAIGVFLVQALSTLFLSNFITDKINLIKYPNARHSISFYFAKYRISDLNLPLKTWITGINDMQQQRRVQCLF